MADEPLALLLWRVLDRIDSWLIQAGLWVADVLCGAETETDPEQWRQYDQERI